MKVVNCCIALLFGAFTSSLASAQELTNTATVWVCPDSQTAHGICTSKWHGFEQGNLFGGPDLNFKCQLFRNTTEKAADTRVLEDVTSSGEQFSTLLETRLEGYTANYCTKNVSSMATGFSTIIDSFQTCRPHSAGGIAP